MGHSSGERAFQPDGGMGNINVSRVVDGGHLETEDQRRSFELLRLAFFVLKLRKLEQRKEAGVEDSEYEFRSSLLRHSIFQQIVTLTALGAREQAMRLIESCRK